MKARLGLLLLAFALPACGQLGSDKPLSRVDRERGMLVLDGPDRVRVKRLQSDRTDDGFFTRVLPWNWFQ